MSFHCCTQQGLHWLTTTFSVDFLCCLQQLWLVSRQIDRLYDWKKSPDTDVVATLKKQKKNTKDEFDERAKAIIVEFAQQVVEPSIITSQSQRCISPPFITRLLKLFLVCFSGSERCLVLREQRPSNVCVVGSHLGPQRRRDGKPHRPIGRADSDLAGSPVSTL